MEEPTRASHRTPRCRSGACTWRNLLERVVELFDAGVVRVRGGTYVELFDAGVVRIHGGTY